MHGDRTYADVDRLTGAMTMVDEQTIAMTGTRELQGRTPLFDVFVALALLSIAVSIISQRPDFLAIGAPFAVAAAIGIARWRPVEGEVRIGIGAPHIVEGDSFDLVVELDAAGQRLERVEVELALGDRLSALGALRAVTTVQGRTTRRLAFPVTADEWGVAQIDDIRLRVTDRFGFFGGSLNRAGSARIRIGLAEDRLQARLEADQFRQVVGSHLSNDRGQGTEIADIRPYLPGDSMRDINWRISNRRHEPWVTLRHPDRSATVVVIVDAHDDERSTRSATQRRSVSVAMALTRGHLANHDPVGLLVVGHAVAWLPPRLGRNQLYRIADELISVGNAPDASLRMYRPPAIYNIGREAIVVAITPLRDPLMVALIAELRSRGNAVAVLVPEAEANPTSRFDVSTRTTTLARRLAAVEHQAGAASLRARGVVMVPWDAEQPVTAVVEAVRRMRQGLKRTASRR